MQCAPRKPEPPVTRTRVSDGVDMNGYELGNGLVLATCEYWESPSSFEGSWFPKQCDDDEKATGCLLGGADAEEGCQWRPEGRALLVFLAGLL